MYFLTLSFFTFTVRSWIFLKSPYWQHFWLEWFETKNNQNLGSKRKYRVLKPGNTDRLRDERESYGLIYRVLHDKSFLLEDERNLHFASQEEYTALSSFISEYHPLKLRAD